MFYVREKNRRWANAGQLTAAVLASISNSPSYAEGEVELQPSCESRACQSLLFTSKDIGVQ